MLNRLKRELAAKKTAAKKDKKTQAIIQLMRYGLEDKK